MCLGMIGKVGRRWVEAGMPMADVDFGDRQSAVCLAYVPAAAEGDHVLVHSGFAIEVIGPVGASEALALRSGAAIAPERAQGPVTSSVPSIP